MQLGLKCVMGPYAGRTAQLNEQDLIIGRGSTANIRLDGVNGVEDSHAKIVCRDGSWYFQDSGTAVGSTVNGLRVGRAPILLKPGMTVEICGCRFEIVVPQSHQDITSAIQVPPSVNQSSSLPPKAKRPWGFALNEAIAQYDKAVRDVIRDGYISSEEILQLKAFQNRLGLDDSDTHSMRVNAAIKIIDTAIQHDRMDLIDLNDHIFVELGIRGSQDPLLYSALRRAYAHSAQKSMSLGQLPVVPNSQINLGDSEICHVEVGAQLLEERVVHSGWVSGHAGTSFRIAKGVRFHVGATRGRRVSQTAVVPVSQGTLAITNERVVFKGNPKSFDAKWKRILSVDPYADGLTIYIANRSKPPTLVYLHPELAEVIAGVCSAYIS